MQLKCIAFFSLVCFTSLLSAQTYDISQYGARFESRPFLEINPSLFYSGQITNRFLEDQHSGGGSLAIDWREQSNQDDRILTFSLAGRAQFSRQEYENSDLLDQSRKGASLSAGVTRYNYYQPNKFWGFRGSFAINAQDRDNEMLISDRSTSISVRPGVFFGTGRLEFAEDALLANWMMDDLVENGVISSAKPEQREALARRITSIIGNRTFDFRRRRIYELQQLNALFAEQGITTSDDFLLFAILNDNWAFVTPQTLPHGKRWQFGLDAGGNYLYRSMPQPNDYFTLEGRPYVNFSSAKIKHNNAASIWSAQVEASYRDLSDRDDFSPSIADNTYGGAVSLGYEYRWMPISRTSLRWQNQLVAQWNADDFAGSSEPFNSQTYFLSTGLQWDYFVAYNWRFVLSVGVDGTFNKNQFFDTNILNPYFSFSTRYAIF